MPPPEETISSLVEFTTAVEQARQSANGPLWFRGVGDSDYTLEPSLFRHPKRRESLDVLELEHELLLRFRQRSVPYLDRTVGDDWDCLFLMQHFGVPTRLLDWSENPFVALYFALTSANRKPRQPTAVIAAKLLKCPTLSNYRSHIGVELMPSSHSY
jgi:hypothetical protein